MSYHECVKTEILLLVSRNKSQNKLTNEYNEARLRHLMTDAVYL